MIDELLKDHRVFSPNENGNIIIEYLKGITNLWFWYLCFSLFIFVCSFPIVFIVYWINKLINLLLIINW